MTKTENFALNQWDAGDVIKRSDFNADNAAIDAALAAVRSEAAEGRQTLAEDLAGASADLAALAADLGSTGQNARIVYGSYTGTGTYGKTAPNSLTFDFCPVLVLVGSNRTNNYNAINPTVLIRGRTVACSDTPHQDALSYTMSVSWTDNGVSWYGTDNATGQDNVSNTTYYYVAIGWDNPAEQA